MSACLLWLQHMKGAFRGCEDEQATLTMRVNYGKLNNNTFFLFLFASVRSKTEILLENLLNERIYKDISEYKGNQIIFQDNIFLLCAVLIVLFTNTYLVLFFLSSAISFEDSSHSNASHSDSIPFPYSHSSSSAHTHTHTNPFTRSVFF